MQYLGDPTGSTTAAIGVEANADTVSFGTMTVCMQDSGTSGVITNVAPLDTVGSGWQLAGILIHATTAPNQDLTGTADGFPPPALVSRGEEPIGFVVDTHCTDHPTRFIELIVGLTRTSEEGGGWLGVALSYTVGKQAYVLELRNDMILCGTATDAHCRHSQPGATASSSP